MRSDTVSNKIALKKRKAQLTLLSVSASMLAACGTKSETGNTADDFTVIPTIQGDDEINTLVGKIDENDIVYGLGGNDFIRGLSGDDIIYGGEGNDNIYGDDGDDTLYGGSGDDIIRAGDGDDKSFGGNGDDIIYLSSGTDFEDGGEGNDTIKIVSGNNNTPVTYDLYIGQYYYTAQGGGSNVNMASIENIQSAASADTTVYDTPSDNIISTAGGDDHIYSIGGNDIISTAGGDDYVSLKVGEYVIDLGSGDDTLVLSLSSSKLNGGAGSDTVMVRESDGIEIVYIHLANELYFIESLGSSHDGLDKSLENFENVTIDGTVDSTIFGTSANNIIVGSDGTDVISAGAGDDTVSGGLANDTIDAEAGSDLISGGAGDDTFVQSLGDSTVATAQTIAAAGTIAADDTITFGNGLDIYTDFVVGNASEAIDTDNAGSTLTSLIGQDEAALTDNVLTFASGNYDAATGVFTITANGAGADTLIIDVDNVNNEASDVLSTSSSMFLLQGVDSDDLVAGDFL